MAECPKKNLLHTCGILCIHLVTVLGFNLDTVIPVVKEGPDNSYFGFSIAQHQELKRIPGTQNFDKSSVIGNYIVVGAPNLDLQFSNENYTGGVYKCNALSPKRNDCELLLKNEYSPSSTVDNGRNNQWLGVVVRSGGPGKGVVACAHRYKELKQTRNSVKIYGIGSCYLMTQDLQFNINLAQGRLLKPCQPFPKGLEHEEYAFCQSGISAFITEEERLIVGSPGAINWRGMLTEVDISPHFGIKKVYKSPTLDSDVIKPPVPLISYLGFAVTGGKFDNTGNTYYVAGAPRSQNTGQVIFFTETHSGNILRYENSQILSGDLPFSGYGQDLIAVDINNDGYDDLVVGCPFYYEKEKDRMGGAVYVYIGNGDMITSLTKKQVIKGRSMSQEECDSLLCLHARFGFSLATAGDLNRDNFGDFAVGAPYEGQGAVYIFHGFADGVKEAYSQRIYAGDLSDTTGWNTFGYSLSGGMDLDNNDYPDLLVGSYIQNKVALLRTRPIIMLHSKVNVSPNKLNMSTDEQKTCEHDGKMVYCVEVKLCLRYTAEPVEKFNASVDILYTIIAEPGKLSPRVEFMKDGNKTQEVKDTFMLLPQRTTGLSADDPDATFACISHTAYLKTPIIDVLSAIEFGINFALPEKDPPVASSADVLPDINEFPILDAGIDSVENQTVMTKVEFLKNCGVDQICNSNLQMKVSPKLRKDEDGNLVLEIWRSGSVRVQVYIENIGEIAYQTEFYLSKPKSLTWQQSEPKDIGCDVYNDTLIKCQSIGSKDNGNPLKAGAVTVFALLFQVDRKAIATTRSIQLTAWVDTKSIEVTPAADKVVIPIVVYVNADLQVFGIAEPDSVIFSCNVREDSAIKNEFMIGKSVNHTYTIYNNGPDSVESSEITILWPYETASKYPHGKHLLYLMKPPKVLNGGDATCYDRPDIVNVKGVAVESSGPEDTVNNGQHRKRQADTSGERPPMEIRENEPKVGEVNVVLFECAKDRAKCYKIRCKIGILNSGQSVKIQIRARLWENTLIEDYSGVDEVHIKSTGRIHIRQEMNVVQSNIQNDEYQATTIAIPSLITCIVKEKPLAWWIYALSVLGGLFGGLFVLILLTLCLWKCGFFKRKRYNEVSSYGVKVEKKKNILDNPLKSTKVETKKDDIDNPLCKTKVETQKEDIDNPFHNTQVETKKEDIDNPLYKTMVETKEYIDNPLYKTMVETKKEDIDYSLHNTKVEIKKEDIDNPLYKTMVETKEYIDNPLYKTMVETKKGDIDNSLHNTHVQTEKEDIENPYMTLP